MISSKNSETKYEVALFDKRKKNKKEKIVKIIDFIFNSWLGILLMVFGIYLIWIANSLR